MPRGSAPRFSWRRRPPRSPRRRRWRASRTRGDGARLAAAVFARNAPSGATGKPSVAATSRAATVTATVAYDGVAPSNFGSVFGYGAFHVSASATSHALVANSEARATP